jgi:multidrug resistance protein, MATE family
MTSASTAVSSAADPAPPRLRRLLGLAWPIVVSRSTQVVIGVADALMVAPLGEAALAATTTGALNAFAFFILPMGVVFIVSTFSSQLYGEGDLEAARRYGFYGLAVAFAAAVVSLAAIAATDWFLEAFPYAPDVREQMSGYLKIRLLSGGAAIGMESFAAYYGGLGNTRLPMRANVGAMVLNVAGNWLLIGGHLGAPAMGVIGAAWASTVATTIAFVGLLLCFLNDGRATGRVVPSLYLAELGRMLRYGLPSGFNWFFEFLAFSFFVNVVVAGLGTTSLAGMMAVIQINSVSFMPGFGVASAGAILVGQAIGADAKDHVPVIVRRTFLTAAAWQGLVGLAYLLVPGVLFEPFAPAGEEGAELRAVGAHLLMLSAAWQLFDSAAATLGEALRAAGDTAFALWARTVLAWCVFAPGAYATVRWLGWGDAGAVFWLVAYLGLLAAVLTARFRSGAWRRFRLTEPIPEVTAAH